MDTMYNYNHLIKELIDIENDYLSRNSTIDKGIDDVSKIFDDTCRVIKMRIPKKILVTTKTWPFGCKRYYCFCSNCNEELPSKNYNYCPYCGQAIYFEFAEDDFI